MIEVIPFRRDLFSSFNLDKTELTRYCYINNSNLISKLLTIELPISNTRIALKNIFDFLAYVDIELNKNKTTIIPIPSFILEEYFSRNLYKEYMNILHDLNVITAVSYDDGSFYTKGKLYTQYRIHNSYINDEDLAIIILDENRSKNEFTNQVEGLDERYIKTIKTINIDIKEAIKSEIQYYIDNNLSIATLRNRISRLFYTKRKRFIKKGKSVNRIYHSFSNVSKVSRAHIDMKLFNIDIKNCQPLLLVYLLTKENMSLDSDYQLDCEKGRFYENFIGIKGLDRDQVKVELYKTVFFGFNKASLINKKFKELYPNTWNSLDKISITELPLAGRLQNIESELFNNLTPRKSNHYFTLFDAIYFDDMRDIKDISKNINKFFNNLNIKVKTEINL
jgi:hypothetical protein